MKKLLICSLICFATQLIAGTPGTIKWSKELNLSVVAPPTLGDSNGMIYIGSINNLLIALDTQDGSEKWRSKFTAGIYSPVAYDADSHIIDVTTNAISAQEIGGIYTVDEYTGNLINPGQPVSPLCQLGRPILANNILPGLSHKLIAFTEYCASDGVYQGAIIELDAFSEFMLTLNYEQLPYDPSTVEPYRKKEITFDQNPNPLYSNLEGILTVTNGVMPQLLQPVGPAIADWNIKTSHPFDPDARFWQGNIIPNVKFSTPTYDTNYNLVYVGGSDGNLYAYDPRSQSLNTAPVFILQLGGDLSQNPPLAGFGGRYPARVYITSGNGNLYSISIVRSSSDSNSVRAILNWQIHLSDSGFASRPVQDSLPGGGTPLIYTVDKAGTLYGTRDDDAVGNPQYWSPIKNLNITATSDHITSDGFNHLLYLVSSNGTVSAFIGATG
jgi:outer membrane protein assembly factor BamB